MNSLFYFWSLPYFRWDIIFVFIPFIIVFLFLRKYFFLYRKTLLAVLILSILGTTVFDLVDLQFLHVYFYNPTQDLGIHFLGIPLEEYLPMIFAPTGMAVLFLALRRKLLYGKV